MKGALAGAAMGAAGLRATPATARGRGRGFANELDTFSYVVVLMLENRSFDNLLGGLYPSSPTFDGILGKDLSNPIPAGVPAPPGVTSIAPFAVSDYHTPYPDPGEVYPNVNTQLFGVIQAPYNLPDPVPTTPPMNGFVRDYVANYPAGLASPPSYDQYRVIMGYYPPERVTVLSALAREFAVFDHWHCSVPSQTWCNRAFWHAATSWGHVANPTDTTTTLEWLLDSSGTTLFNLLLADPAKNLDWRIYSSNYASLTGLIHSRALDTYHLTRFPSLEQFFTDCAAGSLTQYSFLEPLFWTPSNDQHPASYDSTDYGPSVAGSVVLGENLVNQVYDAVRTSASKTGNNWENTLLIITHDEHGGCYDHVQPPAGTPPGGFSRNEDDFRFDRLGIRVPMVMISAHIAPGTIVNTVHDHTSFLKALEAKWGLPNLTERDTVAPDIREVFTSSHTRDVSTWPVIPSHVVPPESTTVDFSGAPLNELQRSILVAAAATPQAAAAGVAVERLQTVGEATAFLAALSGLPGAHPPPPPSFWLRP
jgi:phospholipase C